MPCSHASENVKHSLNRQMNFHLLGFFLMCIAHILQPPPFFVFNILAFYSFNMVFNVVLISDQEAPSVSC